MIGGSCVFFHITPRINTLAHAPTTDPNPTEMEGDTRDAEEGGEGKGDGERPPPAKKPKNAWTLTASLIQNLESSMGTRPASSAMIARLTSSSIQPAATAAGATTTTSGVASATAAASTSAAAPSSTAAAGAGRLTLTIRLGGAAAPALVDGEEDVFIDYVDGVPGDAALKIFGARKQLCVRPAPVDPGEDGGEGAAAAATAAPAAEGDEREEVYAIDGEIPPGVGGPTASKPKRQRTPPPPSDRPPVPPRVDEEVAGGEEYFMANWRYFLEWNLRKDPDEVMKKLDNNQNRSGKPFDIYGFYVAVVSRGGYQDEVRTHFIYLFFLCSCSPRRRYIQSASMIAV